MAEEQARLDREQQFKKEQAQAEAELYELQQRLHQQQFNEVLAESNTIVSESEHAVAALFEKLDGWIGGRCALADVQPLAQRVNMLFEQQQAKHDACLNIARAFITSLPPAAGTAHTDSGYESVQRNMGILRQHEMQIGPAWMLDYALVWFIAQAGSDEQRIQRIGVVYALTGRLHEVDRQHPPERDTLLNSLKERVSRTKRIR